MTEGRRLAVVLGSNGPSNGRIDALKYARRDAERFAAALASPECGFTVELPPPEASLADALNALERAAEECGENDEFVCYFSGHGVLLNGTLVLLWDHTDLERAPLATAIPISRVMTALAFCKARNRLLVLDCCHAGAAAALLGLKSAGAVPFDQLDLGLTSANYLVLLASDRLERARELDSHGGSFMTASICACLEDMPDGADLDGDGQVSVQDLARWLVFAAHQQNTRAETVPVPYLAGHSRGPFYLTREPDWPVWKARLPNGDTATLLPGSARRAAWPDDREPHVVMAIADHLVTNRHFREFVGDVRQKSPAGQDFVDGGWRGPFEPWDDPRFTADENPVVCVTADSARRYCSWLARSSNGWTELTGPDGQRRGARIRGIDLPTFDEWDRAHLTTSRAGWLRHASSSYRSAPRFVDTTQSVVHDQSNAPANVHAIDRANRWGIVDLLGNVWEWCYSRYADHARDWAPGLPKLNPVREVIRVVPGSSDYRDRDFEVRGGGFLDDASAIDLAINAAVLADGKGTSHSDLGFRVVMLIEVDHDRDDTLPKVRDWPHNRASSGAIAIGVIHGPVTQTPPHLSD